MTAVVTFLFDYQRLTGESYNISQEKYIEFSKELFKVNVPIYIFCEAAMVDKISNLRQESITTIIPFKIEETYYFKDIEIIKECYRNNQYGYLCGLRPNQMYLLMMSWTKIWALNEAIKMNKYNSKVFTWVDFGIFKATPDTTHETLSHILTHPSEKIKLMLLQETHSDELKDKRKIYLNYRWKTSAQIISIPNHLFDIFKEKFDQEYELMIKMRLPVYEEQLLSVIVTENRSVFDVYYGDYGDIFRSYFNYQSTAKITFFNLHHCMDHQLYDIVTQIGYQLIDNKLINYSKKETILIFHEVLIGAAQYGDLSLSKKAAEIIEKNIYGIELRDILGILIRSLKYHQINVKVLSYPTHDLQLVFLLEKLFKVKFQCEYNLILNVSDYFLLSPLIEGNRINKEDQTKGIHLLKNNPFNPRIDDLIDQWNQLFR